MKNVNTSIVMVVSDIETPEDRLAAAFQKIKEIGRLPWQPRLRPCPVPAHEILRQRARSC